MFFFLIFIKLINKFKDESNDSNLKILRIIFSQNRGLKSNAWAKKRAGDCFVKRGIGISRKRSMSRCSWPCHHGVGGHADRTNMLLGMCKPDFVVARLFRLPSCLFYLPPRRAGTMESVAKRRSERTDTRRVGGTSGWVRFVVLENRILIAWMPSRSWLIAQFPPQKKASDDRIVEQCSECRHLCRLSKYKSTFIPCKSWKTTFESLTRILCHFKITGAQ